jgi:hypothetical protein
VRRSFILYWKSPRSGSRESTMKTLPGTWRLKTTRSLFLISLFTISMRVRAQDSAEFAPKDAHAVTVHADNGVELQARFNGQGPITVIFDTGSMNIMSPSVARKLDLTVGGTGALEGMGRLSAGKGRNGRQRRNRRESLCTTRSLRS